MNIPYVDDICQNKKQCKFHSGGCQVVDRRVVAKPEEVGGLLKWKNRLKQAISIMRGKSIAVKFHF